MYKPHIVLLVPDFDTENTGGLTRFAEALAYAIDRAQFKVSLLALWSRNTSAETQRIQRLKDAGFNPQTLAPFNAEHPYRAFLAAYRKLSAALHALTPDLIHCHSEFGEIAMVFLKLTGKLPCPALRTAHNVEWKKRPVRRAVLSNLAYLWTFQQEFAVSAEITAALNQRLLAKRLQKTADWLPNAIDLTRFQTAQPDPKRLSQWGLTEEDTLVLAIGRLSPQKGFADLIQAAVHLRETQSAIHILIVGEGPDRATLEAQITTLGLQETVQLVGTQTNIETLLPLATLVVSSSHWEGLPTVILESMAAQVPVLATDIAGNNTLIQHEENGWLVPVSDSTALATQLLSALAQSNSFAAITQNALKTATTFSIQTVASKHAAIYRAVLQ